MLRKSNNDKIKLILISILLLGTICYLFLFYLPVSHGGYSPKTVIKAKQAEAKAYLKTMNRYQQAYRIEHSSFTTDITAVGIPEHTDSYTYRIIPSAKSDTQVTHLAVAKQPDLRSYIGEVAVVSGDTTVAIVCESQQSSQIAPLTPAFVNDSLACAPGSREIKKRALR
jgi:hypothetical protein